MSITRAEQINNQWHHCKTDDRQPGAGRVTSHVIKRLNYDDRSAPSTKCHIRVSKNCIDRLTSDTQLTDQRRPTTDN